MMQLSIIVTDTDTGPLITLAAAGALDALLLRPALISPQ